MNENVQLSSGGAQENELRGRGKTYLIVLEGLAGCKDFTGMNQ